MWDLLAVCTSVYHQLLNQQGGTYGVDDGGVRIKGAGALWQLATLAMNKIRQNNMRTPV
jgi:hypothetical protein